MRLRGLSSKLHWPPPPVFRPPEKYKTAVPVSANLRSVAKGVAMQAVHLVRVALAFVVAGCAGYVLAAGLMTTVTLLRLSDVGAEISMGDAARTVWFDLRGMAPSLESPQYGSVILIGFALAFPVAALLRHGALRIKSVAKIAPFLYPLAGATAIATILVLSFQTYEVYAFAGARGWLGNLAQCSAGACAGYLFQILMSPSEARA